MKSAKVPSLSEIRKWMTRLAREHHIPQQARDTWSHSLLNWKFADRIAKILTKRGIPVDRHFLKVACMVHDIGRMVTGSKASVELMDATYHAFIGYRLVKRKGYGEKLARVCIVHMGGTGLDARVCKQYKFIGRDFFPTSIEEKILAYADARNTYSAKQGRHIGSFRRAYHRFAQYGKSVERLAAIHEELQLLTNHSIEKLVP
ncbi:MAG: HD domain-containing protein [Candidatus Kerfeldbacteria bacterium]|nr:HD domain-containing protein [Candidatus Kerfeldbacteria bacterium]